MAGGFIGNSLYARRAISNAMDPQKNYNSNAYNSASTITTPDSASNEWTKTEDSANESVVAEKTVEAMREVLPRVGYLHQEDNLSFVLCKPKLLPLKSFNLEKLEKMQEEFMKKAKEDMETGSLD